MRLITVALIILLMLIQYPLWWGHSSWLRVYALQQQLARQQKKNDEQKLRNEQVGAEVQDLRICTSAIEERARYEMGMVKNDEVFVQFVSPHVLLPSSNTATTTR